MPGKSAKTKGYLAEHELKNMHNDMGVFCKRVPLSGAAPGYKGDLVILEEFQAEVKKRAEGNGFATLERWLGQNDMLFLKRNRQLPMVVLDWATYTKLIRGYKSCNMNDAMLSVMTDQKEVKEVDDES